MLRRRILAAATATVLALGMSVGGAGAALANPDSEVATIAPDRPCNEFGYTKIDSETGNQSFEWGTLVWNGSGLTVTMEPGWSVDLCLKGGREDNVFVDGSTGGFYNVTQGSISHIGWMNPVFQSVTPSFTTADQRCEDSVFLVGGSITVDTKGGAISYEVKDSGGNVVTDLSDLAPGVYTVTPTATGSVPLDLAGYNATATIGAFDGDCDPPTLGTASVAFTYAPPTCELAQSVEVNEVSTANATLSSTDTSVPGQVTFLFTADEDSVFSESEPPTFSGTGPEPVVLSVDISDDFTELTVIVQLLGADEELCDSVDPVEVTAAIDFSYDCFLGGSLNLSDVDGIIWSVNGEPTSQRQWTGLPLEFTANITASLDPERPELFFSDDSELSATVSFVEPFPCDLTTLPLVEPNVTTTQATCAASGSYTLSDTEGVQWVVNGENVNAGTYTAAPGSTVSIEAVALDGFGFGPETQTEWELEFAAAPTNCDDLDLPTLALTGASGMLGTVGIVALLITLTGIGVVATRRRVEV